jgi:hypothetical protein
MFRPTRYWRDRGTCRAHTGQDAVVVRKAVSRWFTWPSVGSKKCPSTSAIVSCCRSTWALSWRPMSPTSDSPMSLIPALRCARCGAPADRVVLGTESIVEDAMLATVQVINRDGTVAGFQDKVQLDPSEGRYLLARFWKADFPRRPLAFGIAICHEGWRYPETVRWAIRNGKHTCSTLISTPPRLPGLEVRRSCELIPLKSNPRLLSSRNQRGRRYNPSLARRLTCDVARVF